MPIRENYEVLEVTARSKPGGNPDTIANDFLRKHSFVLAGDSTMNHLFKRAVPAESFVGRYQVRLQGESDRLSARLILTGDGEYNVDTGRFVSKNPKGEELEIVMTGSFMLEWKILCQPISAGSAHRNGSATTAPAPSPASVLTPPSSAPASSPSQAPLAGGTRLNPGESLVPKVILRIPVNRIRPNAGQPRKVFNSAEMKQLISSMLQDKQQELIEVIRIFGDPKADYELVKGERRWRGAQGLKWDTIEALVRTADEVPNKAVQHRRCLIADLHHATYSKLETALALLREKENGASTEELCTIFARKPAWINRHLLLNQLHPDVKKMLDPKLPSGKQISFEIAWRLASLFQEQQLEVWNKVAPIRGTGFKIREAKRLIVGLIPRQRSERDARPGYNCKNLDRIVPRIAVDTTTLEEYGDETFDCLIKNRGAEDVDAMLAHLKQTEGKLASLQGKIRSARERWSPALGGSPSDRAT